MSSQQIDLHRQAKGGTLTDAEIANAAGIKLSKLEALTIRADGLQPFTGAPSIGGNRITNVGTPTTDTDAATRGSVASQIAAAIGSLPSGSGTPGTLPKWNTSSTLVDSTVREATAGNVTIGDASGVVANVAIQSGAGLGTATSGRIRLPNNTAIRWRDQGNTTNLGISVASNNALQVEGAAQWVTQPLTDPGGGSIYKEGTYGLMVRAVAGATYDLTLMGVTLNVMAVPAGTNNAQFFGNVSAPSGNVLAGGTVTAAGVIYERNRAAPVGGWTAYTPTLSNLTLGNGTLTAKYARIGDVCHVEVLIVFGSTSVMGSAPLVSLPVPHTILGSTPNMLDIGNAWLRQSTSVAYRGGARAVDANTIEATSIGGAGVTDARVLQVQAGVPFTWGAGCSLFIYAVYPTA